MNRVRVLILLCLAAAAPSCGPRSQSASSLSDAQYARIQQKYTAVYNRSSQVLQLLAEFEYTLEDGRIHNVVITDQSRVEVDGDTLVRVWAEHDIPYYALNKRVPSTELKKSYTFLFVDRNGAEKWTKASVTFGKIELFRQEPYQDGSAYEATTVHDLGDRYDYGQPAGTQESETVKRYRKAADKGDAKAMYGLGSCYAHGLGVAPDQAKAVFWWRKAVAKGDTDAKMALERLGK
ncbi:sel1 repeat family protein [bacterium AH-315-M10]|nr:sel1 repeat family protein [bacterium AH-315-M10]MBN4055068.1 sel1 repeat family protein [Acidimicrobium ferrooxidans]